MIQRLSSVGCALFLCLAACSDSDDEPNEPPVLSSVEAPAEVTAANGIYVIPVTLRWSDADGDAIAKLRYRIPDANVDKTNDAPNDSVGVRLQIMVSEDVAKKSYDILFSAIDARGLEGVAVMKTVTLK